MAEKEKSSLAEIRISLRVNKYTDAELRVITEAAEKAAKEIAKDSDADPKSIKVEVSLYKNASSDKEKYKKK